MTLFDFRLTLLGVWFLIVARQGLWRSRGWASWADPPWWAELLVCHREDRILFEEIIMAMTGVIYVVVGLVGGMFDDSMLFVASILVIGSFIAIAVSTLGLAILAALRPK